MPSPSPSVSGAQPAAQTPLQRVRRVAPVWLAVVLGLATSVLAWHAAVHHEQQRDDEHFSHYAALAAGNVQQRLEHAQDLLLAMAAPFRRPGEVSRREFHDLFEDLRVAQRFPEVRAIQWSRHLSEAQRPAFEQAVRRDRSLLPEGYPDYAVHPPGPRERYAAVEFNEPMQGNEAAFGHDHLAEAARREQVERAIDSGLPQSSPPLKLLQGELGFILRVPVYAATGAKDKPAQRRAAFRGLVSGVFVAERLMQAAGEGRQASPYEVSLRDLGLLQPGPEAPLQAPVLMARWQAPAAAGSGAGAGAGAGPAEPPSYAPEHVRSHSFVVGGRQWALDVARPARRAGLAPLPLLALGGGLMITALVVLMLLRQTRRAHQARAMAQAWGTQAQATTEHLHAVIDSAADGILTLDLQGRLISANRAAEGIFGLDRGQLVGRTIGDLLPSVAASAVPGDPLAGWRMGDPGAGVAGRRTAEARRADDTPFPIELVLAETSDGECARIVCTVRDLTEAKAADEAIAMTMQELNQVTELQQAMLRHAAFAIVLTDAAGDVRAFNPAAERLLGCSADEVVNNGSFGRFFDADEMHALAEAWSASAGVSAAPGMSFLAASLGASASVEHELHLKRGDGRRVPVSLTVSGVRDEQGQIASLLLIAYDVTARRQMVAEMTQLAYTDRLTGLANRSQFDRELPRALAEAKRRNVHLALLFIDLDRFKPINDNFGHAMGDRVLCLVGQRLKSVTRGSDLVARLGGDEFVVLLPSLAAPQASAVVAEKILSMLAEPMLLDGQRLEVGASIGVVSFPDGGENAEDLLESADRAMYEAKQAGRNCYRLAPKTDFAPADFAPLAPQREPTLR